MSRTHPSRAARIFGALLRLLPFDFRWKFGAEMEEMFREQHDEARAEGDEMGIVRLWWETLKGILTTAPREHWEMLGQDTRFAFRSLRKNRSFTFVAVLTLAVGIGANTAIFSVVHAVLLRPLPYEKPQRLVHIFETKQNQEFNRREASYPDYLDWQRNNSVFEEVAGYNGGSRTVPADGLPDRVRVMTVTENFFRMLGVEAALGRTFLPGEDKQGAEPVVILTHGAWQNRFGGDSAIVGKSIELSQTLYTVVGVLPPGFEFPLRGRAEFCLPEIPSPAQLERRFWHWLDVIGRMKENVTIEQAEAEMNILAGEIAREDPRWHAGTGIQLVPLRDVITGPYRVVLLLLLGAVGLVLLIACGNVANLLLARSISRSREMSIRVALGASRWRLARQMLTESAVLSLLGGAAGILLAERAVGWLVAGLPYRQRVSLPHLQELDLSWSVLAVALGVTMLTGIVFGLVPALRAMRTEPQRALAEGSRGASGPARRRLSQLLVISEVALALILLVGAGLITKSLYRLMRVDPGFDTSNLITLRVFVSPTSDDVVTFLSSFHGELLERIEAIPGVTGAASVSQLPLTGRGNTGSFTVEGRAPEERTEVNIRSVSPSYFQTMGIALSAGRSFTQQDQADTPEVVLVNERLARLVFPDGDSVGHRITFPFFDGQPAWEIIGVVSNEQVDHLAGGLTPVVYFPFDQDPGRTFSLVVRSEVDPGAVISAIRQEVIELNPNVPVYEVSTMERIVSDSTPVFVRRYLMSLLAAFSGLAVILALVGIYGVMSYTVAQRAHELGIRMALGATPWRIFRLVLGQGAGLGGLGLALGVAGTAGLSRLLSGVLFNVSPTDFSTIAWVTVALGVVVTLACYVPARRATKVDPMVALRYE